ncbi:hypothetical protein ONZ45_g1365 [Pleurotus djamor]|nr:hypothetical protein ONZ45_g1365 [Pleurotus djamor]
MAPRGTKKNKAPAADQSPKVPRAYWTIIQTKILLDHLVENKAAAGDGANFTKTTWTAAAIKANVKHKSGPRKTADMCRGKYKTLKTTFEVVDKLRNNSGWSWDDEKGADITPEKEGMWNDYVEMNPGASSFAKKGWPYLQYFDAFMPSRAKGKYVFHASQALPSDQPSSEPPADDADVADPSMGHDTPSPEEPNEEDAPNEPSNTPDAAVSSPSPESHGADSESTEPATTNLDTTPIFKVSYHLP